MQHGLVVAAVFAFAANVGASAATPHEQIGLWSYEELRDPITDARRGIASLQTDAGMLIIKCDENGPTSIYVEVVPTKYLGREAGSRGRVVVRFGAQAPQEQSWI